MSATRIVVQCKCGGAIDVKASGDGTAEEIVRMFWSVHSEDGCGVATVNEAKAARWATR